MTELQLEKENTRGKETARRMLGMYRLMYEESIGRGNKVIRIDKPYTTTNAVTTKAWSEFKDIVLEELHNHVTSDKAMDEILDRATKDTGSLSDLLYSDFHFPKQSINIRVGSVMESAVRRFLGNETIDMREELVNGLHAFNEYRTQLDIATQTDDLVNITEVKYNLNLDTGKITDTLNKLDNFNIYLKKRYKLTDMDTSVWLVSFRYPTAGQIPGLKTDLEANKDRYIMGYQEMFYGYGYVVTENMWKRLHKTMEQHIMAAYAKATD